MVKQVLPVQNGLSQKMAFGYATVRRLPLKGWAQGGTQGENKAELTEKKKKKKKGQKMFSREKKQT